MADMRAVISYGFEQDVINLVQDGGRPDLSDEQIHEFIHADWQEPEHSRWLHDASREEIADWVLAGLANVEAEDLD